MPRITVYGGRTYNSSSGVFYPYVGPGDIMPGALAWYGLRAYSKGAIGSKCVQIARVSDSTRTDFVTVSSGGVDLGSIAAFLAGTTGGIHTLYDQTGNGNHLVQTNGPNQPVFNLNGGSITSMPVLNFNGSGTNGTQTLLLGGSAFNNGAAIPQPYTMSSVAAFDNSGSNGPPLAGNFTTDASAIYLSPSVHSPQNAVLYAGASLLPSSNFSINTLYAMQGVLNGASSDFNVNGVSTVGNAGTANFGVTTVYAGDDGFNDYLFGVVAECGLWPYAFTPTQSSNMSANQRGYWGF